MLPCETKGFGKETDQGLRWMDNGYGTGVVLNDDLGAGTNALKQRAKIARRFTIRYVYHAFCHLSR
ncbi:MAG: hypothetical protein WBD87_14190 [Candidatus Acidiferrales bacterium]